MIAALTLALVVGLQFLMLSMATDRGNLELNRAERMWQVAHGMFCAAFMWRVFQYGSSVSEFEVPGLAEKGRRYVPEISVEQLSKASFNVSELVEAEQNAARIHYIVVGADDFDGRPFWFTREMLKMGVVNASYYPDGAESLAAALAE